MAGLTAALPIAVHRATLPNGLRVVVSPDRSAPVVAVAVYYNVGMRSEPVGRTGFAHLFEHLMFQGSQSLPKLDHFRYVESSGGSFDGSTHMDDTRYFGLLPKNASRAARGHSCTNQRASKEVPQRGTDR